MSKNLKGKTRKVDNPYETWVSCDGSWEWRVLKHWQSPDGEDKNQYARVYCAVKSPYTYGSWEYGDVYLRDIMQNAVIKGSL